MTQERKNLADIQGLPADLPIALDRVGVAGLRLPLALKDRDNGIQKTIAMADLGVNLDARHKGVHMSRFVETLNAWNETLGFQSMFRLLSTLRDRLDATRAWAKFTFPYLINRASPSGAKARMAYECAISGLLRDNELSFALGIEVPVMTVCPCSLAISSQGAHSQRALARMRLRLSRFIWLEDLIELAETSASSPVYPLLKRIDEKTVTETAFTNPAFVEDVARRLARRLSECPDISAYAIDVESMESIHAHNAFASLGKNVALLEGHPL